MADKLARKARKTARSKKRGFSQMKRARQSLKRRATNRARKSMIKTFVKKAVVAASTGSTETESLLRRGQSLLDKASKGSTLHKRTAARKKSRMMRAINKALAAQSH